MTGIEDFTLLEKLNLNFNSVSVLDVTQNLQLTELECASNSLTSLNVTLNILLTRLETANNNLGTLNVTQNILLTYLQSGYNGLSTIDVTKNTQLTDLRVQGNIFTTIEISQNTLLTWLNVYGNQLTAIDLSKNTVLGGMNAGANQLTALDVSYSGVFNTLSCNDNALTSLKIKNGNNTSSYGLNTQNNSSLMCIEADATVPSAGYSGWTTDGGHTFSTDCSSVWAVATSTATTIALLAIPGIDADNDGIITLAEAAAYSGTLDLSGTGITDVAGLGAFTSITTLDISGNTITDLSPLTGLSITLIQRSTGNTKTVARAALSLEMLIVSGNKLLSVNLDGLQDLKIIDISNNPDLVTVSVKNGNNAAITSFDSSGTPNLTCILVDNINATYLSSWTLDAGNKFAADEVDCRARVLSVNDVLLEKEVALYPNPTTDVLHIKMSNQLTLTKVKIVNLIGKTVLQSTTHTILVESLANGLYLVQIETDKGIIIKKLIKK